MELPAGSGSRPARSTRSSIRSARTTCSWPSSSVSSRPGSTPSSGSNAVAEYGVKAEGSAAGASARTLAELAGLIADGQLEVPIAATFPLSQVQDAYRRLASGHIRGKIVLTV